MLDLLSYDFMQRAFLAAFLTGLTAPAVGVFLVQRRLALLGDGIGHVALTGVALGLITGIAPVYTAIAVAALGAVAIELVRVWGRTNGDLALAMLFYGGIAGGVLLTNLAGDSAANLTGYLFGSLTTVTSQDLWVIIVMALVVLVVTVGLGPQLFAVCQDEDHARVSGVPVRLYTILLAILAAVTVTVAMRTVGLLLVSALMIVPVATAQQLTRSFKGTFALAMVLGWVAAIVGVFLSFDADTQPGPTIVMLALAMFALAVLVGRAIRRGSARRTRRRRLKVERSQS